MIIFERINYVHKDEVTPEEREAGINLKTDAVLIDVDKGPYGSDENNFCFTTPAQGTITFIFVGAIVEDVVLGTVTSGAWNIVAHTAVGVAGGVSEVIAKKVTMWPG